MNILDQIAAQTRERIEAEKRQTPTEVLIRRIEEAAHKKSKQSFYEALKKPGMSYICEVKKASPSKGLIAPDFPYLDIARDYEAAGASAISCLTEPFRFLGKDTYLQEIAAQVEIPVLRKDFTVDEYMIYQARALGASAVLLICAILDDAQLRSYRELAGSLGLDALVEAHDETEVCRAVKSGARIIGVNNRDLKTFQVDVTNSVRLRSLIPEGTVYVSESGIRSAQDIQILRENRVDAVLIGETLMRSPQKREALEELNGGKLGVSRQTKIKICGLSRPEDIAAVNEAKPDYAGFVVEVPKSRRNVSVAKLRELMALLDPDITSVGVFVNAPVDLVAGLLQDGVLAMAQLHGQEDATYVEALKKQTGRPVIQAFSIRTQEDVQRAFASPADYILLDQGSGGSGQTFDWSLLEDADVLEEADHTTESGRRQPKPFFLAGGLGAENLAEAIRKVHPFAVDLSSCLETDGKKDAGKIREAVQIVNKTK